jgi:putative salt-induced outer membrane protein
MKNFSLVLSVVTILGTTIGAASAQDKPDGKWHGAAGVGISFAAGNTSSNAISITGDTAKETTADKITIYGLMLRAESKTAGVTNKTSDLLKVGGRYDWNINDRLYAFGGGELERNQLIGLTMRTSLNGGLGYKLIRDANTTFDIFGGIGWSGFDYRAPLKDRNGVELLLGEESTHKLSPTVSFKQRFVYYPGAKDLGNRATFDAGLSAALAGNLTANVTSSNRYQSKVPFGAKSTDTLLLVGVGVGYKF